MESPLFKTFWLEANEIFTPDPVTGLSYLGIGELELGLIIE